MNIKNVKREVPPRESALRLYKLTQSGVMLDADELELVKGFNFDNQADRDNRDEFVSWNEVSSLDELDLTPEKLIDGPIANLIDAIKKWNFITDKPEFTEDVFRELFLVMPGKVLNALSQLAAQDCWHVKAWKIVFRELNYEMFQNKCVVRQINEALDLAKPAQLKKLDSTVLRYIKLAAKDYDIDNEVIFSALWLKIWRVINKTKSALPHHHDVIATAINSPAGEMAMAALTRLGKYPREDAGGLPTSVKEYLNEITSDKDGHYGRVVLATELFLLFSIAPEWTRENLIAQLVPVESETTQELWLAYSSSQRLEPNLFATLKDPFVDILSNQNVLSDASERSERLRRYLANLFMLACFRLPPDSLTQEEKKRIVNSMSEEMLITVLSYFRDRMTGDEELRANIWQKNIKPWLDQNWPKMQKYKTAQLSEIMLAIVTNCGSAYSEAAQWFMNDLKPINGRALHTFQNIEFTNESTTVTLNMLSKIIDKAVFDSNDSNRNALKQILDRLKEVNSELKNDPNFNFLCRIASS